MDDSGSGMQQSNLNQFLKHKVDQLDHTSHLVSGEGFEGPMGSNNLMDLTLNLYNQLTEESQKIFEHHEETKENHSKYSQAIGAIDSKTKNVEREQQRAKQQANRMHQEISRNLLTIIRDIN